VLIKVRYSVKDMLLWTRQETFLFLVYALGVTAAIELGGLDYLYVPWAPVAVVGTAVAFIVGFQNNAAYGRIWEARKIWGGVVNESRSFGMKVLDFVTDEHAKDPVSDDELQQHRKTLIYRHMGWLTALRHAMRQPRKWEEFDSHTTNREWSEAACIPERRATLQDDLRRHIPEGECATIEARTNKAAAILNLQSRHLRELKEKGLVWEFAFLELENLLQQLFALQGKSERIKNFPYPRQYATLSFQFVWIFIILVPFAAVPEFAKMGKALAAANPAAADYFVWVAVPFSALISWLFHTMERIGRVGENPFEGTANDVPISTISRGIEIDLHEMLDEDKDEKPLQFPALRDVQM
jgi:putative membrane protein